jgi:hypothetical protein
MTALGIAVEQRKVEAVKWLIPLSQQTLNQKMGKVENVYMFNSIRKPFVICIRKMKI